MSEPAQKAERKPLVFVVRQVDAFEVRGEVEARDWLRMSEDEKAMQVAGLHSQAVAVASKAHPGCMFGFATPKIENVKGSLTIGENGVIRNLVKIRAGVMVFEPIQQVEMGEADGDGEQRN